MSITKENLHIDILFFGDTFYNMFTLKISINLLNFLHEIRDDRNIRTSHRVEWLTGNGSCFIAKDTLTLCKDKGITNCFTPVRSPESNGMAEAFVKTIKWDYVKVNPLPDALSAMSKMNEWIEDYNEYAPHKELKWLSPKQFIRKMGLLCYQEEISPGAAQANKAA